MEQSVDFEQGTLAKNQIRNNVLEYSRYQVTPPSLFPYSRLTIIKGFLMILQRNCDGLDFLNRMSPKEPRGAVLHCHYTSC
jgi:hypothetical protein